MSFRPLLLGFAVVVAAPATASAAEGGLSSTPAVIERTITSGDFGSVTIANTTRNPMRVNVRVRPWRQSRNGAVSPDRRRVLRAARPSSPSFVLAPGTNRSVDFSLAATGSSSLYGAIEVTGRRLEAPRRGLVVDYRLVGSLRLNPIDSKTIRRMAAGSIRGVGAGKRRRDVVAVRNRGNTVEPISGTLRVRGPRGTVVRRVRAARILPGESVDLPLPRVGAGRHRVTVTLHQGGQTVLNTTRGFRAS